MKVRVLFFSLATMMCIASNVFATKYVITFESYSYSPNTLSVAVGDTIEWDGSFSSHPLVAVTFPSGATKFSTVNSGTSFQYVITAPGTYNYWCAYHHASPFNMTGSFTTQSNAVPVKDAKQLLTELFPPTPNPTNGMTMIDFSLAKAGTAKITITTIDGKMISTPVNEYIQAGGQMIDIDVSKFASGTYIVTLEADGQRFSKEMVVAK